MTPEFPLTMEELKIIAGWFGSVRPNSRICAKISCHASGVPCPFTSLAGKRTFCSLGTDRKRSIQHLADLEPDQRQADFLVSQNLMFERVTVNRGKSYRISCINGAECHLLDAYDEADSGYLFFVLDDRSIPTLLQNAFGTPTGVFLTGTSAPDAGTAPSPAANAAGTPSKKNPASTYAVQ